MNEDVIVREARPEELDRIEALVQEAYAEFQPLFPERAWQGWMANIAQVIHAAEGMLLVAVRSGEIVGAAKFYPDAQQSAMGRWPEGAAAIRVLAVRPGRRGQGYGALLTRECLRRARELHIPTIYLYTGVFMDAARRLYERFGFKRAPEFDRDPGPIAYRLDL